MTDTTAYSPENLLLGLLEIEPSYGYQLHRTLEAELRHVWRLSQSQVYSLLTRLEERQFIRGTPESNPKRPDRVRYEPTATGRQRLYQWLNSPLGPSLRLFRVVFLSQVYLGRKLPHFDLAQLVDRQRRSLEAAIPDLERELERITDETSLPALSLQVRLHHLRALLAWLEQNQMALVTEGEYET